MSLPLIAHCDSGGAAQARVTLSSNASTISCGDRTERDRDRAATDHAVDHGDDRSEGEELLAPLGRHRSVLEHPSSVVVPGEQEELRLVPGDLLVVIADPVDRD